MVRSAISVTLVLAGLGFLLTTVGVPVEALGLLALCAVIVVAASFTMIEVDDVPETTVPSDRAPPPSRALEPTPVTFGESPHPLISTILNPHPDNRKRRASRAERDTVVWELEQHLTDERLTETEFDSRHDKALKATTRGDLADLLDDLPRIRQRPRS